MGDLTEIFITENDFRTRYQYCEKDLLGEGGFAQVYKAFDKQFQEYVALKFYNKGDQGKYDVLHEMKDSRRYSHPNIIRVHDAFVVRFDHTGGHSYVQVGILEFANGGNLRDFIRTKPTEESFKDVLVGILNGLEYLHHEKKLIHRDLSPENILMYNEEDIWIPKIADFGISKRIDFVSTAKDKTKSTQLLGKVDYMAPEQFYPEKFGIGGKINTNVDLWAFGVILYELFMERRPFENDSQDNPLRIIQSITNSPVSNLIEIPEPYRSIIKKCLEKNANSRVKNASELITILQKSLIKKPIQLTRTLPIHDINIKRKKHKYLYLSILVITLLCATGYFISRIATPSNQNLASPFNLSARLSEIKKLINEKNYKQAMVQINQLPDSLKAKKDIDYLRNQCILSIQMDSLLLESDQLFNKKNYNAAIIIYRKILSEYDPTNSVSKDRIDSINFILNELNHPAERKDGIYRKGMFSIGMYPESAAIELVSIEFTNTATIISLKLKAGKSRYFGSPGTSAAYYIEYDNKKEKLNLKNISGIRTGTSNFYEEDTVFQLFFNNLPQNVKEFNLINGDERFHKEYKGEYSDFIGIKIN